MLCIRLQRLGKKKQPVYRLIVSEKTKDTQAGSLEILGLYNPIPNPKQIELKKERIEYWLSVGAQPSATVHNLLVKEGILKDKKQKSVYLSKKRIEKIKAKAPAPEVKEEPAPEAPKEAAPEKAPEAAEAPATE